jgi:hypothetical protein
VRHYVAARGTWAGNANGGVRDVNWREFQDMVASLEQQLASDVSVASPAFLVDRNESRREIDVLITHRSGPREYLTAVECRQREEIDDITWMDNLVGKYRDDLPQVDRVVAVSASGFSASALRKAANHGIEAYALDETDTSNWRTVFGVSHLTYLVSAVDHKNLAVYLDGLEEGTPSADGLSLDPQEQIFAFDDGTRVSAHQIWSWNVKPRLEAQHGTMAPVPPRPVRAAVHVAKELPLFLVAGTDRYLVRSMVMDAVWEIREVRARFAPAQEYRDEVTGSIIAGVVRTVDSIDLHGRPTVVELRYVPLEDDPRGVAELSVRLIPVADQASEVHEES